VSGWVGDHSPAAAAAARIWLEFDTVFLLLCVLVTLLLLLLLLPLLPLLPIFIGPACPLWLGLHTHAHARGGILNLPLWYGGWGDLIVARV